MTIKELQVKCHLADAMLEEVFSLSAEHVIKEAVDRYSALGEVFKGKEKEALKEVIKSRIRDLFWPGM